MTDQADYLQTLRDTLLAEREKLGITVPAAQIGTAGSSAPIDAGMSTALEQLVLLSQLYAGRSEDDITRGYSEGTIGLVRQYMQDRGVEIETIDKLTVSIQQLDTLADGQEKSTFDQQYRPGLTDLYAFKAESASLLAGTAHGDAVPGPRSLTEVFAASGTNTAPVIAPEVEADNGEPETVARSGPPMREVTRYYSHDDIVAIRAKSIQSVEEQAALTAWDATWTGHAAEKGFTAISERRDEAIEAYSNRFTTRNAIISERDGLTSQNASLLEGLKDRTVTLNVDGQTYRMSWNEMYEECGYYEFNDSDFQTKLRRAANHALEELKESEGYNTRTGEIASLNRQISAHFGKISNELAAANREFNAAWADIRNDKLEVAFNVTDYTAQPDETVQVVLKTGGL